MITENPLRRAAILMLSGQLLYITATQLHAGGDANDHHAIFATYAENAIWTGVHVAQFAGVALLVAGLVAVFVAPQLRDRLWSRFGLGLAGTSLATYAVLQAIDGVALKQAVAAWHIASSAEEPARFAAAESIRWLEWGVRSYHDYALGLTMLLLATAGLGNLLPRAVAVLAALCGASYLTQGWIAGTDGFSSAQSMAIVLSWVFGLLWMGPLVFAKPRAPAASAALAS